MLNQLETNPVYILKSELNWTLERIAEEIDYSVSAVSKWSSGHRNPHPRASKAALEVLEKYRK